MTRALFVTAALVAAVAAFAALSLPPARLRLEAPGPARPLAGVLHIHTNRSDGRSSPDEIAAIARDAGLDFIVFTDHGDGTRVPDPPIYRSGVLCIDGVEISTNGGHYLALDLPPAPYPLGGEARDVVEDVRRLGGFGAAAHPDSPKSELRWDDWRLPFDGVEVLNPDTSWRIYLDRGGWRPKAALFDALFSYPIRPAETIAHLLDASNVRDERWAALVEERAAVALGGVDAHARLELAPREPGENRFTLPFPGYRALFDTLRIHVEAGPATGDAAADGARVLRSIREGRLFVAVNGLAAPPEFEFTASEGDRTVSQGGTIAASGSPLTLTVRTNAPPTFTTRVWEGSRVLLSQPSAPAVTIDVTARPAVYRVEIDAGSGAPVWIVSNPIYVRGAAPPEAAAGEPPGRAQPASMRPLYEAARAELWLAEHDPASEATLAIAADGAAARLRLRYALSPEEGRRQFAALTVLTPGGLAGAERLTFTARAERPLRISVQLRAVVEDGSVQRWQRSAYVDATPREITLPFAEFTPVGAGAIGGAPVERSHSLVFAIDRTNTAPAAAGEFSIERPFTSAR